MNKKLKILIIVNYIILISIFIIDICACVYFITVNSTETIFNENILKVVEIKVSDDEESWGYATGFFIDKNGTILTNKHVVLNSSTNKEYIHVLVRTAAMEDYVAAEISNISENDDLAILKTSLSKTSYFKLANKIDNGEMIYTIGNPNGFGLSFTSGVISSDSRNVIYNNITINTIQTSLVINEGNSGGPVFNSKGELIGIISFRLKDKNDDVIQGCSFALPFTTISNFINSINKV